MTESNDSKPAARPTPPTPYEQLGGREKVLALAECFYDKMELREPALTALHDGEPGKVSRRSRDRFALFLVGWLGGPQDYIVQNGHPRLRMRHGRVPINIEMRDAWMRSMNAAMDAQEIRGEIRSFLNARFAELADFLRNVQEPSSPTNTAGEPGISLRKRTE